MIVTAHGQTSMCNSHVVRNSGDVNSDNDITIRFITGYVRQLLYIQ